MLVSPDRYEIYYAGKLWALIPQLYRTEDSTAIDKAGPLRELVDRLGAQIAVVRRSIDRLWEDQSIESCDDWVIPYIADLLATNLVPGLDARGQRLDVAKTIYYRRRKGTVAVLEEIATDVTGWESRVVEFFRRMGRWRHALDPAIAPAIEPSFPDRLQSAQGLVGAKTHTGIGGFADLRNRYGAARAHTAFDEFAHYADFRRGLGRFGWHNIPRLGAFVWRLKSFAMDQCTPVPVNGCANWYTFDPTGRDIPLFAFDLRKETGQFGDSWAPPEEWQLPAPIDDALLDAERDHLYSTSLGVYTETAGGFNLVPATDVTVYPETGRFHVANPPVTLPVLGAYCYGFSASIGAGPYDRRSHTVEQPDPQAAISGGGALNVAPAGTTTINDSLTYTNATAVTGITGASIVAANETRPVLRLAPGESWVLTGAVGAVLTMDGLLVSGGDVILKGEFESVRLRSVTLDPGSTGTGNSVFQNAADGRALAPVRLWVEGHVRSLVIERSITGPIRTRNGGSLGELRASESILQGIAATDFGPFSTSGIHDPMSLAVKLKNAATPLTRTLVSSFPAGLRTELANYDGAQPPPTTLVSAIAQSLNTVIQGPNLFSPALFEGVALNPATQTLLASNPTGSALVRLNRLLLADAFPMEFADLAAAMADGDTTLSRVTVLGAMHVHRIEASECILEGFVSTEDTQRGCVRFTAFVKGSVLPRKYESVSIPLNAPLFTSRVFGRPGYAQLLESADSAVLAPAGASVLEGAQDGSEMGVFAGEKNPQKERGLLIKFDEFMPLGLAPVVVHVT